MYINFKILSKIYSTNLFKYSLGLICYIFVSPVYGMEASQLEQDRLLLQSHFQEDASVISNALSSFQEAELHFYWTTGYDPIALKSNYGATFHVDIGGSKFGSLFPICLNFLLQFSPQNLVIKLVCDSMTQESNQTWLESLKQKYETRFQILPITDIINNILEVFPDQKDNLNSIFLNATQGNPAISSDIYRLGGMIYGNSSNLENVYSKQFTYCDVDTFCFGMLQPNQQLNSYFDFDEMCFKKNALRDANGHTNLIKVLFSPLKIPTIRKSLVTEYQDPETSFYIGRKDNGDRNNNIIKTRIKNIDSYKNFFLSAIYEVMSSQELKNTSYKELNLLNYFALLHGHIARGENDTEKEFGDYLETFANSSINIQDIVYVTGPGLIDRLVTKGQNCFPLGQEYPDITVMEWNRTSYLGKGFCSPLNSVVKISKLDLTIESKALKGFTQYNGRIADAFYAQRFGKNHPFTIKLMDYLSTNFPYATQGFKSYLKQQYESDIKVLRSPIDAWLNRQFESLSRNYETTSELDVLRLLDAPYYVKLSHTLKLLGINRPLTREDIDFRL